MQPVRFLPSEILGMTAFPVPVVRQSYRFPCHRAGCAPTDSEYTLSSFCIRPESPVCRDFLMFCFHNDNFCSLQRYLSPSIPTRFFYVVIKVVDESFPFAAAYRSVSSANITSRESFADAVPSHSTVVSCCRSICQHSCLLADT